VRELSHTQKVFTALSFFGLLNFVKVARKQGLNKVIGVVQPCASSAQSTSPTGLRLPCITARWGSIAALNLYSIACAFAACDRLFLSLGPISIHRS